MKKKLTKKQAEVFDLISSYEGGFLRRHIKRNSTKCYRLLTSTSAPKANLGEGIADKLIGLDYLIKKDDVWIVNQHRALAI